MERKFTTAVVAAEVNSVEAFRDKVERSKPGYRPLVRKSVREVLPNAPEPRTMSDVFRQAR